MCLIYLSTHQSINQSYQSSSSSDNIQFQKSLTTKTLCHHSLPLPLLLLHWTTALISLHPSSSVMFIATSATLSLRYNIHMYNNLHIYNLISSLSFLPLHSFIHSFLGVYMFVNCVCISWSFPFFHPWSFSAPAIRSALQPFNLMEGIEEIKKF